MFTLIINRRFTEYIESNNLIKPHQIRFRQGYRIADHAFVLNTILNSYFKKGKRVYACFVDFSKAYDTVWRNGLLYKLINNGLSYKFTSLIKSMYEDIKMAVKLPGGLTPFFESVVGLRQGCNISPMLFNVYVNDLIEELQNDDCDPVIINNCSISCLMYADDLLILSESWEGLTTSLNKLDTFSNKWKLTISEKKTKIMVFSKNGRQPFFET